MNFYRNQMKAGVLLLATVLSLLIPAPGHTEPFDHEHAVWNLLVKNNVHWNLNCTAS